MLNGGHNYKIRFSRGFYLLANRNNRISPGSKLNIKMKGN